MLRFELDEEGDDEVDDLDYFESPEHAELETVLFESTSPAEREGALARARAAQSEGLISRAALAQIMETARHTDPE